MNMISIQVMLSLGLLWVALGALVITAVVFLFKRINKLEEGQEDLKADVSKILEKLSAMSK